MKKQYLFQLSDYRWFFVIFLVAIIVLLPGCTQKSETQPSQQQQTEEVERPEHSVSPDPAPLADSDWSLSLEGYGAKGALADQDLSIADMLMYAIQDEYLAHGEYEATIEKFGNVTPFANIVKSEETHIAFLSDIYNAYGVDIPEDDSASHVVVPESLLEGAKTCVQAEIDNIAMYENFLSYELPDDIRSVFEALKAASESHLKAFQKQVDRLS